MDISRILAIDIGGGTQDLFLYEEGKPVENCVQMVLPSPTVLVADTIAELTQKERDIFLSGYLMGGGASSRAVKRHIKKGLKVYAAPQAAKTIRDDLREVMGLGVIITDENPGAVEVSMGDICYEEIKRALNLFKVKMPSSFAIAVQDHGEVPGNESNRKIRFKHWKDFIDQGGCISDLLYFDPPSYFTRMKSVKEQLQNVVLMDTGSAAIWGALCDEHVQKWSDEGVTLLNLGNQHTVGILLKKGRVLGLFEHHTRLLDRQKLKYFVENLIDGSLKNEDVFEDNGHGCTITDRYSEEENFNRVVVTGPRRHLSKGMGYYWASPMGNMMLAGAFGLVSALLEVKEGKNLLDKEKTTD